MSTIKCPEPDCVLDKDDEAHFKHVEPGGDPVHWDAQGNAW